MVDNNVSQGSSIKGAGGGGLAEALDPIIDTWWGALARRSIDAWMERCDSTANDADRPSRLLTPYGMGP